MAGPMSFRYNRSLDGHSLHKQGVAQMLAKLDELTQGADFLVGHNLIDLSHLRAANPNLRLSRLPTDRRHAASV